MDDASFRVAFPAFADTTKYPDARLDMLATIADSMFAASVWGVRQSYAAMLYVAHSLSISGATGSSRGSSGGGPVSSKTVDKVSVSYDTASGTYADAGWWNRSPYGVELYQMILVVGAGPRHILGNTVVPPWPYGQGLR